MSHKERKSSNVKSKHSLKLQRRERLYISHFSNTGTFILIHRLDTKKEPNIPKMILH